MKTQLLVLAAGMGSRFGGVKQVVAVGSHGEAVLEYSIHDALEAGFDEVVFIIRKDIEDDFRSQILSRLPPRVHSRLVFQERASLLTADERAAAKAAGRSKPWGTGHALLCAETAIDSPFAVINADDFYGRASFSLVHDCLAATDPAASDFCMAGFELIRTTSPHGAVSRGLCDLDVRPEGSFLRSVVEHTAIRVEEGRCLSRVSESELELPPSSTVSMNLWGFTPAVFGLARPLFRRFIETELASAKREFQLPTFVDELVASGRARVRVIPTPETWFGITYREDLGPARERVAELGRAGLYPEPLWSRDPGSGGAAGSGGTR